MEVGKMKIYTKNGIKYITKIFGTRTVMIVAVINTHVGDWAPYVKDVPGIDHTKEWMDVANTGGKLSQKEAEFFFPHTSGLYRYRP